jgi:nucleoid-associated protein YgaU
MRIKSELHAPPIVRFIWDRAIFRGVLDNLSITYELFTEAGIPLRAKAALSLIAYRPVEVQVREIKAASPDTEKSVVLRRGDRLDGIAATIFRDPARWRDIALANAISDPRKVEPGRLLLVPRIPKGRTT